MDPPKVPRAPQLILAESVEATETHKTKQLYLTLSGEYHTEHCGLWTVVTEFLLLRAF